MTLGRSGGGGLVMKPQSKGYIKGWDSNTLVAMRTRRGVGQAGSSDQFLEDETVLRFL